MSIKNLLRLLQAAPDKDAEVFIPSIDNCCTTSIGYSYDDVNNLELYQVYDESNNQ